MGKLIGLEDGAPDIADGETCVLRNRLVLVDLDGFTNTARVPLFDVCK